MSNRFSSTRADSERWRLLLQSISVIVAIEIALHSFIVAEPILTLVGAALWVGGALWTRRGGKGGLVLIGTLALWEIIASLLLSQEFAEGSNIPSWILSVHVVSVAAALLVVATIFVRGGSNTPESIAG